MAQINIDLEHYNGCESGFGSHDRWVNINNSFNSSQNQEYEEFGLTMPIQHQLPSLYHATHQQLCPLFMPSNPVQHSMLMNPARHSATLVAPSLGKGNAPRLPSIRATPSPRKTLTDSDRRRMCQYQEDNPTVKQTELGALFGVERSTVSKILKQRQKYLFAEDCQAEDKNAEGKFPDIERAVAIWAIKLQNTGVPVTDAAIKEKADFFATVVGYNESYLRTKRTNWLEKFKKKNGIGAGKARRASNNSLNAGSERDSTSRTPTGISPISPSALPSPPCFVYKTGSNSGSCMCSQQSQKPAPGSDFKQPRSQTFPMLGIDPSIISSPPTKTLNPKLVLETPLPSASDSSTHHMPPPFRMVPAISSSPLHHSSSNGPLVSPSSIPTAGLHSSPGSSAPRWLTQDDVQQALNTVLKYLQQVPLADQNEYITFVKLADKLRFQSCSDGALPKTSTEFQNFQRRKWSHLMSAGY